MTFEFTPQKLVYRGHALGHHDTHPVLVPRVLAGERLRVESVRTAKGVIHARLLEVLEPAPERVDPPCPYFGRCGGCQYQHLEAGHQVAVKRDILRETLRRIGKIIWPGEIPAHTAHPWNYRNQAELKVARLPEGGVALGFFEAESHRVSPIDQCLILSPRLNAVLDELRRPESSARLAGCREIHLLADDRDENVMLTFGLNGAIGEAEAGLVELAQKLPGVTALAVQQRHSSPRLLAGPGLGYQVGDFRYQLSPGVFFQSSRHLTGALVAAVVEAEGDRALDLFAGVGLFTLPLARRFRQVVAVEASAAAVSDLRRHQQAYGLANIHAVRETVFDFLRRSAQPEPDLVVLDPPRAGVGVTTLQQLAGLGPKRIHYVSCSPPTLARDLKDLVERDYRLESVQLFDFFPQTYHIESLVKLARGSRSAA